MTSTDDKFQTRHTCIICKKKRYEAHMRRVGCINVNATKYRSSEHWVCVQGRGYESFTNCHAYYLDKMQTIASMFERLGERRL